MKRLILPLKRYLGQNMKVAALLHFNQNLHCNCRRLAQKTNYAGDINYFNTLQKLTRASVNYFYEEGTPTELQR